MGRDLLRGSIVAPRPLRSGLASNAKPVLSAAWLPAAVVNPARTTSSITAGSLVDLLGIEPRRLDCQPSVLPLSLQARTGGQRGSRTHSICVQGRCIPVLLAARRLRGSAALTLYPQPAECLRYQESLVALSRPTRCGPFTWVAGLEPAPPPYCRLIMAGTTGIEPASLR